MAMIAGNVLIDSSGNESTKTGMAGDIYDQLILNAQGPPDLIPKNVAALITYKTELGKMSRAIATGVVGYIVANADVEIQTSDSALQRDPDSSSDTLGPSAKKTLSSAIV